MRHIFATYNLPLAFFSLLIIVFWTSSADDAPLLDGRVGAIIYGFILTLIWSFISALFKYDRHKDSKVFYSMFVPLVAIILTFSIRIIKSIARDIGSIYAERVDENCLTSLRLYTDSNYQIKVDEVDETYYRNGIYRQHGNMILLTENKIKGIKASRTDTLFIESSYLYKLSSKNDTIEVYRIRD